MNLTPERLAHGEEFLEAVNKAMANIDDVFASVHEWGDGGTTYPPLARRETEWRDSVDPEKLEKLRNLVYFLTTALFGRDCDGDSVVRFEMVHLGTHEDFLPRRRVARVDSSMDATLEDHVRNLEHTRGILRTVQARVDEKQRRVDSDVKELVMEKALFAAARDCFDCEGKGWRTAPPGMEDRTDYRVYCRGWGIGASDMHGPYRVPCDCQSERDLVGWPLSDG